MKSPQQITKMYVLINIHNWWRNSIILCGNNLLLNNLINQWVYAWTHEFEITELMVLQSALSLASVIDG